MCSTALFIILPLNLLKEINKLRFTSILGVFSLIVLLVILIVQLPSYLSFYWKSVYKQFDDSTHINWFDISSGFDKNMFFFKATASMFYSFCCHLGAFPVYQKIINRTDKRTEKVFMRSILLDASVYALIGICGYLTQVKDTPEMIIERETLEGSTDIAMSIGRLLVVIMFLTKVPATYTCMRISVFSLLWDTEEISDTK